MVTVAHSRKYPNNAVWHMPNIGRPTKLTPELQESIVNAIRAGNYMETAAQYAGVSKQNLYIWLKKGNDSETGIHAAFRDAVEKALAEAEVRDVSVIGKAALNNWQAAAWRLERKNHARWGRKDKIDATLHGPNGGPIETIHREMTPEEAAKAYAAEVADN